MVYADFGFYSAQYGGRLIPEDDFTGYARRASAFLDSLTLNRIKEPVSESIKMAVCEVAELYFKDDQRGGVSSENNDGFSVTYDTRRSLEAKAANVAAPYLANTGLLYRGMNR